MTNGEQDLKHNSTTSNCPFASEEIDLVIEAAQSFRECDLEQQNPALNAKWNSIISKLEAMRFEINQNHGSDIAGILIPAPDVERIYSDMQRIANHKFVPMTVNGEEFRYVIPSAVIAENCLNYLARIAVLELK